MHSPCYYVVPHDALLRSTSDYTTSRRCTTTSRSPPPLLPYEDEVLLRRRPHHYFPYIDVVPLCPLDQNHRKSCTCDSLHCPLDPRSAISCAPRRTSAPPHLRTSAPPNLRTSAPRTSAPSAPSLYTFLYPIPADWRTAFIWQ